VALLAVVSLGFVAADAGQASSPQQAPSLRSVVVQPGQSLWGFARVSLPGMDPREAVLRIRDLNGLSGSVIHPGQVLKVPAPR
jgi:LysM repeat protein